MASHRRGRQLAFLAQTREGQSACTAAAIHSCFLNLLSPPKQESSFVMELESGAGHLKHQI